MIATLLRRMNVSLAAVILALPLAVQAAVPAATETVDSDLTAAIEIAARHPDQFAVDVPHPVSVARDGAWSVAAGTATWTYAVRFPGAVSLSLHAIKAAWPSSAVLAVRGSRGVYRYRGADLHRGQLWSRIVRGETLSLELTVPSAERRNVEFEIRAFQVGYRGFGFDVPDHPTYARIKERVRSEANLQASITDNTSCVQNYQCFVASNNQPAAQATVALVVSNLYQCTGTLLNDVPGDGLPYVLTARHCESGSYGGGKPDAAASVQVYWNAVSACGNALDSIYDAASITQSGASTIVEQQDAWLLKLDSVPPLDNAYYAGFDATGGAVQGGYTIHHALTIAKQFAEWFGQAFPLQQANVLHSSFTSNFLEVVNKTGNIGPGASGSGLFDQNDRLVGSLSLGNDPGANGPYGSCPAPNPQAPNGTNGIADFNALAAVWNSTADTTSSTGTTTLKTALDPANTGNKVVDSIVTPVSLAFVGINIGVVGTSYLLIWTANGASQCTASGGLGGDGWVGILPNNGSASVVEQVTGAVTYRIQCSYANGRVGYAVTTISWVLGDPVAQLTTTRNPMKTWIGTPTRLVWTSNVSAPCAITGGSANFTNLPANGTTTVTEANVGSVTYHLACGSGARIATGDLSFNYIEPSVTLVESNSDLIPGQTYRLDWDTGADQCSTAGGGANDGWSGQQTGGAGDWLPSTVYLNTEGTFTYYLTCTSGSISLTTSATVTVRKVAPYATVVESADTIAVGQPWTLTWNSNLEFCSIYVPLGNDVIYVATSGTTQSGSVTLSFNNAGNYTFVQSCSGAGATEPITSPPVTLTIVPLPDVGLTATPSAVTVGDSFKLQWSSNFAASCAASGGGADGNMWTGDVGTSGNTSIKSTTVGSFTYTLTCPGQLGGLVKTVSASVMVSAASTGGGGSGGGGGGGGGAMEWGELWALSVLAGLSGWRRRGQATRSGARHRWQFSRSSSGWHCRPQRRY